MTNDLLGIRNMYIPKTGLQRNLHSNPFGDFVVKGMNGYISY